jgi:hypothetical protein
MELQAMRSRRRTRDDAVLRQLLEQRRERVAASTHVTETVYLLKALVADFDGLLDVSADGAPLAELSRRPEVKEFHLGDRLSRLSTTASAERESPERSQARPSSTW